jgi:hypothetical protein
MVTAMNRVDSILQDVTPTQKIKTSLERIMIMNEVAYHTLFQSINNSLTKAIQSSDPRDYQKTFDEIRSKFDVCRRATDEIDRLSRRCIQTIDDNLLNEY